jgi:tetratricopeptide (TPR) repeat protein
MLYTMSESISDLKKEFKTQSDVIADQGSKIESQEKRLISLETERRTQDASLLKLTKDYSDHLSKLNSDCNDHVGKYREYLMGLLESWRKYAWLAVATGSLLSLSVLVSGYIWLNDKTKEVKTEMNAKLNEATNVFNGLISKAREEAFVTLTNLINEKSLTDAVIKGEESKFESDFNQNLSDDTLTSVSAVLTEVKLQFDRIYEDPEKYLSLHRKIRVEEIQEIKYSIDHLQEDYAPKLSFGKVNSARRKALIHVSNGFVEQVMGHPDQAKGWFQLAIKTDGNFPEALLYLARCYLQECHYLGTNKWSNPQSKTNALQIIDAAAKLAEATTNRELMKSTCWLYWVSNNFMGAISNIQNELGTELKNGEQYDPRMYARLGQFYTFLYADTKDESDRMSAITAYREAVSSQGKVGTEYLKPLNNLIWYTCHNYADKLQPIQKMNPENVLALRQAVAVYQENPLVKVSSQHLNTLAEALYSLGELDDALKTATNSCVVAEKEINVTHAYTEWLTNRCISMRLGTL